MPGRSGAADLGKRSEAVQQRVDQRAGVYAGAGVHHHAGRLIHHHDVGVFVEDRQRDVFRRGAQRRGLGRLHVDRLPAATSAREARWRAIHQHEAPLIHS